MKSYTNTTSSMKDQKLALTRRHFVASAGIAPIAFGAMSVLTPGTAQAGVMDLLEGDKILGDKSAPIAVVEYASLTCPHCARLHNGTLVKFKKDYVDTGKAYLVFRDFPLDRYAFQASVLAHTAGEGRFFAALNYLFKNQDKWRGASDVTAAIIDMAKAIGVPKAQFEAALKDEKLGESILTDRMVAANDYGVNSTPTLFINGDLYEGNWADYPTFDAYLKSLL